METLTLVYLLSLAAIDHQSLGQIIGQKVGTTRQVLWVKGCTPVDSSYSCCNLTMLYRLSIDAAAHRAAGGGGVGTRPRYRVAFGGAYWPLATAHSDPLWVRTRMGGFTRGIGGMFARRAPGTCPARYLCIKYLISSPKFILTLGSPPSRPH